MTLVSRRTFLRMAGLSGAGLLAAGCQSQVTAPTSDPTSVIPTQISTVTVTPPPVTETPLPTATLTATPTITPTATQAAKASVSIGRAKDYDLKTVRATLETMLDGLGGLGDIVKPGASVAIKVNLTGGAVWADKNKPTATEVFVTHPAVVQALCELLRDAGASKISVVEGVVEAESWPVWGYADAVQSTGAVLVDLNWREPYKSWTTVTPGTQPLVYETFTVNPILTEVDAFISIGKMKCHWTAGVTHAMKNLVGLAPVGFYRREDGQTYRSSLHGDTAKGFDERLIRVILDLNRARPIHLAVVDGIMTSEGAEGPWNAGMKQVKPGVLIAGKDPVAADSVATAVMGFDPNVADLSAPFIRSENYLRMAREMGLGTNLLDEIRVVGESIADVTLPFAPAR